jgi:hypothetical protein
MKTSLFTAEYHLDFLTRDHKKLCEALPFAMAVNGLLELDPGAVGLAASWL